MAFTNPTDDALAELLGRTRTIAVIGLSDNPRRPSYEVAAALEDAGYRIVPVNPALSVWEGHRAAASLDEATQTLKPPDAIDIVDVFRNPEHVDAIVEDCLRLRLPVLWLQLGVVNEPAARRAVEGGMMVVMDRCLKVERARLSSRIRRV